jgi:chemotaxis protein CheD
MHIGGKPGMRLTAVASGEFHVSANDEDVLITYDLGDSIVVMIYDPLARIGGLLHFQMPNSAANPGLSLRQPGAFADTGIPLLLRAAEQCGAQKKRLILKAAGGAQVEGDQSIPQIGKKNYLAMRKILWKTGVVIRHENIGGTATRTVALQVNTGHTVVKEADPSLQEFEWTSLFRWEQDA